MTSTQPTVADADRRRSTHHGSTIWPLWQFGTFVERLRAAEITASMPPRNPAFMPASVTPGRSAVNPSYGPQRVGATAPGRCVGAAPLSSAVSCAPTRIADTAGQAVGTRLATLGAT
jgi:hypothetical protein